MQCNVVDRKGDVVVTGIFELSVLPTDLLFLVVVIVAVSAIISAHVY
jgi:hypothetical protein